MEKIRDANEELDRLDPMEWHNIPIPIVNGILSLKSVVRIQSGCLEYLIKHFSEFEGKFNTRILNLHKTISETSDKIKENEEQTKTLFKNVEKKHKDSIENIQIKVTDDIRIERLTTDSKIEEIRGQVHLCNKKLDLVPTTSQIQSMTQSAIEGNYKKLKNSFKEDIVNPEIYNLTQKLIQLNTDLNTSIESLNTKVHDLQNNFSDNINCLETSISNTTDMSKQQGEYYYEKIELLNKKMDILFDDKAQSEMILRESVNKLDKSLGSQSQEIKNFQSGLNNCEENIKIIHDNINILARPKTPPKPSTPPEPVYVPVPASPKEFPLDDIYSKIDSMKQEIIYQIIEEKEKTLKIVNDQIKNISVYNQKLKNKSEHDLEEIKDKLSWLPISLSQLEGMSPGEARLFTIEARLRSEENSRIQSYNQLLQLIDMNASSKTYQTMENKEFKESKEIKDNKEPRKSVTPFNDKVINSKNSDRKTSPASEWWKKAQDSDRKNWSDSGSLINAKIKFSTPMPELEEANETRARYREQRKSKNIPKSWDIESTLMPRIQSAVPTKSKNFKILGYSNKIY